MTLSHLWMLTFQASITHGPMFTQFEAIHTFIWKAHKTIKTPFCGRAFIKTLIFFSLILVRPHGHTFCNRTTKLLSVASRSRKCFFIGAHMFCITLKMVLYYSKVWLHCDWQNKIKVTAWHSWNDKSFLVINICVLQTIDHKIWYTRFFGCRWNAFSKEDLLWSHWHIK